MTRRATILLSTLLFGCGTGQIQDEEGKNDWAEASLSAALIPAVVITASNTYLNNTPSLVADGNVTTSWNAGDYPPQWIRFDLGAPHDLVHVRLLVKQVPHTGVTEHLVYGSYNGTSYTLLGGFSDTTSNSQWLQLDTPARGIRYIKVETTKSPSWVAWSEIQVNGSRSPSTAPIDPDCPGLYAGHTLMKFGYWGSSFLSPPGDQTPEVASHSNLTFIHDAAWLNPGSGGVDASRDLSRLQTAASHGVKAVLVLRGLFFHDETGQLLPNYQANWNTYAAAVAPQKAHIAAFYPIDEPDSTLQMRNALATVNAAITAKFPNIPIAVTYNHAQVRPNLIIPAGFDWVGFDCYGDWNDCAGHSIPWYFSTLKSKLTTGQKLFLLPDVAIAHPKGQTPPTRQQQLDRVNRIDKYYALALNEPRVIGLVPFMWQRFPRPAPSWDWWGAEEMPIIKAKSVQIGRCITGKL